MSINFKLVDVLQKKNLKITTVESVTGGKIISSIIEVPGASQITEKSFIVYSNQAKIDVLNIDPELIERFGVVSEEVALAMAKNAKKLTNSDVVISTTGEAGPILDNKQVVKGTVCFCVIIGDEEITLSNIFAGNRADIMNSAVEYILNYLYVRLN